MDKPSQGTGQFRFHPEFRPEFNALAEDVKREMISTILAIQMAGGHMAGRPYVDTLKGSKHANMKELRFALRSTVWRFAFAYDPTQNAVVLCGGEKQGVSEKRFYDRLVEKADKRYDDWLDRLNEARLAQLREMGIKEKLASRSKKGRKGWKR